MKFIKNKLTVAISILSVGFLVLIGYSVNRENPSFFEGGVGSIFNGVQKVVYNTGEGVRDFFDIVVNFKEVKEEYATMEERNSELEQKAADYDALKRDYDELRAMLDYKVRNDQFEYKGANIINRTGAGIVELFTIDRGSNDGVKKGSVVITHEGLVGQISEVYSTYSIVQTYGNENISVAAMVENSVKNDGLIKGYKDKDNKLIAKMFSLPIDSTIKPGDVITTSDHEFVYPKGIKIGTVLEVQEDKVNIMKTALVQPFVDLNKLEKLFIIVPKDKK
jgi:rod shape-determining protein MreC